MYTCGALYMYFILPIYTCADHVIGSSELGLTTPDSSTLDSHKSDGPLSMSDDQQIDTEANAGEDGTCVFLNLLV